MHSATVKNADGKELITVTYRPEGSLNTDNKRRARALTVHEEETRDYDDMTITACVVCGDNVRLGNDRRYECLVCQEDFIWDGPPKKARCPNDDKHAIRNYAGRRNYLLTDSNGKPVAGSAISLKIASGEADRAMNDNRFVVVDGAGEKGIVYGYGSVISTCRECNGHVKNMRDAVAHRDERRAACAIVAALNATAFESEGGTRPDGTRVKTIVAINVHDLDALRVFLANYMGPHMVVAPATSAVVYG